MATTVKALCIAVTIENTQGARLARDKQDQWKRDARGWTVCLKYKGRVLTVDFWQGTGCEGDPTASGVLSCLLSDASSADQPFADWAADCGYSNDSIKALAMFKACQKTRNDLKRFLAADFESFMYAEMD